MGGNNNSQIIQRSSELREDLLVSRSKRLAALLMYVQVYAGPIFIINSNTRPLSPNKIGVSPIVRYHNTNRSSISECCNKLWIFLKHVATNILNCFHCAHVGAAYMLGECVQAAVYPLYLCGDRDPEKSHGEIVCE